MLYFTLCDIIHPTTEVLDNELKSSQKKNDFPINFWFLILAHYFFYVFVCFSFHVYILSSVEENCFCLTLWGVTNGERGSRGESGRGLGPSIFEQKKGPTVSVSNTEILLFTAATSYFFLTTKGTFWKGLILKAGPSKKFLIVDHLKDDHSKQDFKH